MTIEIAFNILLSVAMAAVGLLVKRLYGDIDALKHKLDGESKCLYQGLHNVEKTYQSKADARDDQAQILKTLDSIDRKIDKLTDKLDTKADK